MADTVAIEVRRYRPEEKSEPYWQRYEVPVREEWMILDALNYIKDNLDGEDLDLDKA